MSNSARMLEPCLVIFCNIFCWIAGTCYHTAHTTQHTRTPHPNGIKRPSVILYRNIFTHIYIDRWNDARRPPQPHNNGAGSPAKNRNMCSVSFAENRSAPTHTGQQQEPRIRREQRQPGQTATDHFRTMDGRGNTEAGQRTA